MMPKCYICGSYNVNRTINRINDKCSQINYRCLNPECKNIWIDDVSTKEDEK